MSLLKKLAGETAIYGVSSILSRLLHYVILTPYLTRAFVPSQYGVVSEMYTYAALIMVVLTYRMETAFFRFGSKVEDRSQSFNTASGALVLTTIVFVLIMLIFAQPIANALNYPDHKDYIIWFIFILAFDALVSIPFAKLRLENRPIKFAILKILNIVLNILFIFFFLELCPILIENGQNWVAGFYDGNNRIAYIFIANLIAAAVVFIFLLPEYFTTKVKSASFDSALFKRMLVYSLPLVIVGLAGVINQLIAVPFLKFLLPGEIVDNQAQAGIYSAAAKIAVLMSLFIQAFNYASEPFFFRNADRKDSKDIYAQVGQAFALVGAFVFLGIMMYLDAIQFFIGKNFRAGLHIVPILLLAYFCLGLYYNFSIWYKLTDNTKIGAWISVVGAVLTLSVNFFLIPIYGYVVPAWAALLCYAFMATASFIIGKKYYPINYPIGKMLTYIIAAVAIYIFSIWLKPFYGEAMVLNLIGNTFLLIGFAGLIFFLEKDQLKKML